MTNNKWEIGRYALLSVILLAWHNGALANESGSSTVQKPDRADAPTSIPYNEEGKHHADVSDFMLYVVPRVEFKDQCPLDVIQTVIKGYNENKPKSSPPLSIIVLRYPAAECVSRPKPVQMTGELKEIPIGEVIRILAGSVGYHVSIDDDNRIILLEDPFVRNQCISGFRVSSKTASVLGVKELLGEMVVDVSEWFRLQGVEMDSDSQAVYYGRLGFLKMKNRCRELQLMEAAVRLTARMVDRK